jgi:cardiolipin synthase A/B
MRTLFDIGAVVAVLVLGYLLYLLLFERGAFYRVTGSVHELDHEQRLQLLSTLLATPTQAIASFAVLREGQGLYDAQLAAIRDARRSIHLEAYIFRPGAAAEAFVAALRERALGGVRVRVVIDAIGSLGTRSAVFEPLVAAGGVVCRYHPIHLRFLRRWNSRTHRNLLLIDGAVGFIGGAGVGDYWNRSEPPPWRDCVLRVTGPVVAGLQAVFVENWLECAGEVLVDADVFPHRFASDAEQTDTVVPGLVVGSTPTAGLSTRARMLVQFLLASARESIELCSPYFIPDFGIRRELLTARARGVRVRVLTGGPYSDHGIVRRAGRRRYGELLEAGIEIAEYRTHMMHAKVLLVDGRWALVGSTNIDHRSFGLNDEVNLLVWSEALAAQLRATFEEDLGHSDFLDLHGWRRRALSERVLAALGRLIERHQ